MRRFSLLTLTTLLALAACGAPSAPITPDPMPKSSSSVPAGDTSATTVLSGKHVATIRTNKGDITVELDADLAPKTVTNFVTLAKTGYYEGITFHRVIPGFMIQGGDPTGTGAGGESIYGDSFEDEIDPKNAVYAGGYKTGALAMANRGPDTNGSQFFIMDADEPLPPNYTIFGRVTAGQSVVHAIATVDRDGRDKPLSPVTFSVVDVK